MVRRRRNTLDGATSAASGIANEVEMAVGDGSKPLVPTTGVFGYAVGLQQTATGNYDPSAVATAQWADLGVGMFFTGVPFTRMPGLMGSVTSTVQQQAIAAVQIGNANRGYQAFVGAQALENYRFFNSVTWNASEAFNIIGRTKGDRL